MKTKQEQIDEYKNSIIRDILTASGGAPVWHQGSLDITVCRLAEMQYEINELRNEIQKIKSLTSGLERYGRP